MRHPVVPLCILKIIIFDITPTVFGLLTWDFLPRWIIILNLDF